MNCKNGKIQISKHEYSDHYGVKQPTSGLSITFNKECKVEIYLR